MRQRAFYLLKYFLVTVCIFIVAKILFMLFNHSGHDFSLKDVVEVVWHGKSLDFSTSLYLFTVPFLLTIVSLWIRMPRWVFRIWYVVLAILLPLAFVADTSLYEFWQFKLDASCLSYLETPTEAMASVSIGYLIVRLLCLVLCGFDTGLPT